MYQFLAVTFAEWLLLAVVALLNCQWQPAHRLMLNINKCLPDVPTMIWLLVADRLYALPGSATDNTGPACAAERGSQKHILPSQLAVANKPAGQEPRCCCVSR